METAETKALRDIANNLNKLNSTLTKIEKDLNSIDKSLGLMRPKTLNEVREAVGFEPIHRTGEKMGE